jgi:hypothetical protein
VGSPRWEYKRIGVWEHESGTLDRNFQAIERRLIDRWSERLNAVGAEGWELVTEHYDLAATADGFQGSFTGTVKRLISD